MKGKCEQTGDDDKIFRLGIWQGVHNNKLHLLNSDLVNQRLHKKMELPMQGEIREVKRRENSLLSYEKTDFISF